MGEEKIATAIKLPNELLEELSTQEKLLSDKVEYIKIENEETGEVIAVLTPDNFTVENPFVIRIKESW